MAGERKPTSAEEGKALMMEEKETDKGIEEAALNAVHAPERSQGLVDREPQVAAVEPPPPVLRRSGRNRTAPTTGLGGLGTRATPRSRKRARDADDVMPGRRTTPDILPSAPPPPLPIVDGDDYCGCILKASRSVVTVAFATLDEVTRHRTGYILVGEENYCLVLTTAKPDSDGKVHNYFVYFEEKKPPIEAYRLASSPENDILILIVRSDKKHEAVTFSFGPLGYEVVFTVCALSDTHLSDKATAPRVKELEGRLGFYKGTVGTPNCYAMDANNKHIAGSEKYFQLGFTLHDDVITLKNIDDDRHTAEITVSAPVFRLNGKIAGMIFSDGGWTDSKIGILAESIISCLRTEAGGNEWEASLKKLAKAWLKQSLT